MLLCGFSKSSNLGIKPNAPTDINKNINPIKTNGEAIITQKNTIFLLFPFFDELIPLMYLRQK
jgi:hypothetical protein